MRQAENTLGKSTLGKSKLGKSKRGKSEPGNKGAGETHGARERIGYLRSNVPYVSSCSAIAPPSPTTTIDWSLGA